MFRRDKVTLRNLVVVMIPSTALALMIGISCLGRVHAPPQLESVRSSAGGVPEAPAGVTTITSAEEQRGASATGSPETAPTAEPYVVETASPAPPAPPATPAPRVTVQVVVPPPAATPEPTPAVAPAPAATPAPRATQTAAPAPSPTTPPLSPPTFAPNLQIVPGLTSDPAVDAGAYVDLDGGASVQP